jgi:nicotinate phosphoribosyltransferase
MDPIGGPLLTDLYQLNMAQAYLADGRTGSAVFEFAVRSLPQTRGFLVAAGLEQTLQYLETLRFSDDDIAWLAQTGRFDARLLEHLARFRFCGDVDAMGEGTVFFAGEPILRVAAPLPDAQLVETRLINILHFQALVASKAARVVLAAPGKRLVDFGLRRAHGAEAGLMAARASYLAGFDGTATVLAGRLWGLPLYGTMAHAFVQAYEDEASAFERFARARPDELVLLLDTYDTEAAARKVVAMAPHLAEAGVVVRGVRLDSGDLDALSRRVRAILDDGGLRDVIVFASGGLDETAIAALERAGAPIDGYGVGTSLDTSSDAPALDCAYKLVEYAGVPRRKRSAGKVSWPGRKQVWRRYGADGTMAGDVVGLEGDALDGEPLLRPMMRGGSRTDPAASLDEIRVHAASELARLPDALRRLDPDATYGVEMASSLRRLAEQADRSLGVREAGP